MKDRDNIQDLDQEIKIIKDQRMIIIETIEIITEVWIIMRDRDKILRRLQKDNHFIDKIHLINL